MFRASPLLLLLPLILLTGCPGPVDTGADGGATGPFTLTKDGARFIRDGVFFDIPKNAVESDTIIQVTVIDTGIPEIPGRKRISYGFQVSPQSLVFKEPIVIGLAWLPERVPGGVQPNTFDMRRRSGNDAYLELPGPTILQNPFDESQQAIQSHTDRLGTFWVTSPANAAVAELKIDPADGAFLRVGDTQQFTAQVLDAAGAPIEGVDIVWSIVAPRVASVDATGLVTAKDPGEATLTATAAGLSASVPVRVQGTTVGPTTFIHDNPFPTGNDLWGGAISNGYAFFVGGNGTVLSKSPTSQWQRLYSAPAVTLKAAAGNFPTAAVAVGTSLNSGIVIETNGTATPTVKTFATAQPRAVWFDGTYGMAVGDGNDVVIRRNGQWVTEYSPSFESLMSVIGDGNGGFVTVGNLGSIYKYDPVNKVWNSLYDTRLSVLLLAGTLVDANGNEAWAVGANKLWHFVTNAWTAINLPASPVLATTDAIGVVDGKVVVGGATTDGAGYILTYDPAGPTWSSQALRAPQQIRGVFGAGTAGYAVGTYGAVWRYSAGSWVEESRGIYGDVVDIAVAGTSVFAAMNECLDSKCTTIQPRVVTKNSSGDWADLGTAQPFFTALTSIAAKSANEVYVGALGGMYVWNGSSWSAVNITSGVPSFNDIAICGNSLWAVGNTGAAFKGTSTGGPITTLGATSSGAKQAEDLFSVFCPNESDIWIAGDGILLENRTARVTEGVNQATWKTGWSPGAGEGFAFGDAAFGVYWDTTRLNPLIQPGGMYPDIVNSMWGNKPDNLYLVGKTLYPAVFSFGLRSDGAQWSLIDVGSEREPMSISGSSNTEVWIGTKGGGILHGVAP